MKKEIPINEDADNFLVKQYEECQITLFEMLEQARADERERIVAELKTASCDTRECVAFIEASESLGTDKSIKGVGGYSIKPQPNATVADTGEHSGSNPKPEKPKTTKVKL